MTLAKQDTFETGPASPRRISPPGPVEGDEERRGAVHATHAAQRRPPALTHTPNRTLTSREGGHDPVFLTRRGRRVASVIDADDLQRLIEATEDLADVLATRATRAEMASGEAAIPRDEVKADLGLS